MFTTLRGELWVALRAALILAVLAGGAYPLLITCIAEVAWPARANGSPVRTSSGVAGSALVGQVLSGSGWFTGRPGTVQGVPGTTLTGTASNLSPTDARLADTRASRAAEWRARYPGATVPAEMITASGSGLDPHISPEAARVQVSRVAVARGLSPARLDSLVTRRTEPALLGVLGEPRVNVLLLNIAVDSLARGDS